MTSPSPPPTPPVPHSQPPSWGLATSGSNYQPGRPDLIGTFQISEGEGWDGVGETGSLELTNQGFSPLVLGVLLILHLIAVFATGQVLNQKSVAPFFSSWGMAASRDGVFGVEGKNWELRKAELEKTNTFPLHPCFQPQVGPATPDSPIRQPGPPSQPSPLQPPAATPAPPPRLPSLPSPTLAPLPALYSSKLAPHSSGTPVRPPPGTTDS